MVVKEWTVVNFKIGEKKCENELISMPRGWDKEKLWVRDRFEPMTSETPGGRSIHLSYGELMESGAI